MKWQRPEQKPINLGYIYKKGDLWTDASAWRAPRSLARKYVEEFALTFHCDVHAVMPREDSWTLYKNGRPLRLASVLDRLDAWLPIMERFITAVRLHDAKTGGPEES